MPYLSSIEYYLPSNVLTNSALSEEFADWSVERIESKTGIKQRHIASNSESASDLGYLAAEKLLTQSEVERGTIDGLIYCSQSPDYYLPSAACILQERLGLSTSLIAFDFNLGCSGYVYGLSIAYSFIDAGRAKKILLITADTYSKLIHPEDRSVRTLFGDGATATLVEGEPDPSVPFVFGTDGMGANNLIVPAGGLKQRSDPEAKLSEDNSGNKRTCNHLYMNGPEIFNFTIKVIPALISKLLERANTSADEIDLFVFHQANAYMLNHLRRKLGISKDRFVISMENSGNTVSSTIPIALKQELDEGRLKAGMSVMLVGFGVGYSWGGTILKWR